MENILNYIERNIRKNGTLDYDFSLNKYKSNHSSLLFADGAEDGIMYFHTQIAPDEEVINEIIDMIYDIKTQNDIDIVAEKLDKYIRENDVKLFPNIDEILNIIREDQGKLQINLMLLFIIKITCETTNVELVKLGLSLLSLVNISDDQDLLRLVQIFALCDEFTLYANFVLDSIENSNDIRYMLIKKVNGWGKIHLLLSLKPENENIREWLICNGCQNSVGIFYTAYVVAKLIDLEDVLAREELSDEEFNGVNIIMSGLLDTSSPLKTLSGLNNYLEIANNYINQFEKRINNIEYYDVPIMLIKFIDEDQEHIKDGEKIKQRIIDLLNTTKVKSVVEKGIASSDEEIARKALYVIEEIGFKDLYDDIYRWYKKDPFSKHYYLETLLESEVYKDKAIKLLEEIPDEFFEDNYSDPEPIMNSKNPYYQNLLSNIQLLYEYPLVGNKIIVAGLKSKLMYPRNAALKAIFNWMKIKGIMFTSLPKEIKAAVKELQKKEMIKSYKEQLNAFLKIDEDLSNYKEPEIFVNEEDTENLINISLFDSKLDDLFPAEIKYRGNDYFISDMVLSCIKSKNLYTAYVQGSNFDLEYEVHIKVDNDNVVQKLDCTCPCTTLCKHEYATILYLRNKKNRKEKGPIM